MLFPRFKYTGNVYQCATKVSQKHFFLLEPPHNANTMSTKWERLHDVR